MWLVILFTYVNSHKIWACVYTARFSFVTKRVLLCYKKIIKFYGKLVVS